MMLPTIAITAEKKFTRAGVIRILIFSLIDLIQIWLISCAVQSGCDAAMENAIVGCQHLRMESERIRVEIRARSGFKHEMAIVIRTAHQSSAVENAGKLLYVSWQITDRETDAPNRAMVRLGAVNQHNVMQRHLSWLQDDIHRSRLLDRYGNFLAPAQKVVPCKGIPVGKLLERMCSWHNVHTSVLSRARRERDPGGHNIRLGKAPVCRILVPRYARGIVSV